MILPRCVLKEGGVCFLLQVDAAVGCLGVSASRGLPRSRSAFAMAPLTGKLGQVRRVQGLPSQGFSAGQHVVSQTRRRLCMSMTLQWLSKNAPTTQRLGQYSRRIYEPHRIRSISVLNNDKRERFRCHGCQIKRHLTLSFALLPETSSSQRQAPSSIQTPHNLISTPLALCYWLRASATVTHCRRPRTANLYRATTTRAQYFLSPWYP